MFLFVLAIWDNIHVNHTCISGGIFLIFLGMFIFMNLNIMNINTAYQQNAIIFDNFLDEEFPNANYKKKFVLHYDRQRAYI